MGLESASYISELVDTNPVVGDPVGEGDDHLRLIKTVLQTQFSGLSGTTAVTTSEAELNYVDGVTSAIIIKFSNLFLYRQGHRAKASNEHGGTLHGWVKCCCKAKSISKALYPK